MRCLLAQARGNESCNWRLARSTLDQRIWVFSAEIAMNNTNDKAYTSLGTVIPSADWEIATRGAPWLQGSDQIKHLNLGLCG